MQTELINLSTGLKEVHPGDYAILYNQQTGYKRLVEVSNKSKTQVTVEYGQKYNILSGKKVPQNSDDFKLLRALTLAEIDDIDSLQNRELLIENIKGILHCLDIDRLKEIEK